MSCVYTVRPMSICFETNHGSYKKILKIVLSTFLIQSIYVEVIVEVQGKNDEENGNNENYEKPANRIKYYKTVVSCIENL